MTHKHINAVCHRDGKSCNLRTAGVYDVWVWSNQYGSAKSWFWMYQQQPDSFIEVTVSVYGGNHRNRHSKSEYLNNKLQRLWLNTSLHIGWILQYLWNYFYILSYANSKKLLFPIKSRTYNQYKDFIFI